MHSPNCSSASLSLRIVPIAIGTLLASAPLSAQYFGEWPLDQTSGTVATDISGVGNNGTLTNFVANPWVPGNLGNALQFDGVDDYVALNNSSIYDGLGTPYSVAYWVKAPAQSNAFVYAEGTIGTAAIMIFGSGQFAADTDKFRVYLRNDQGTEPLIGVSDSIVYDDTWHHVVFVDVAGDITLYIDGVVDTSNIEYDPTRMPGMPGHGTFSNNTASIGALRRGTVCCNMVGLVDDLRLYRFAMSPIDVQIAMAGGPLLPPSASVGEYGVGCGVGPLGLAAAGNAQLGGPGLQLNVASGQPNSLAVLACGLGSIQPVSLGVIGYPTCTFYPQNYVTAFLGIVDAAGNSPAFPFAIPALPSLSYTQMNCQGAALAGSLLEFSPAVLAIVGN